MSNDFDTVQIVQLAEASAVSPEDFTMIQDPAGGKPMKLAIKRLLGRLISTDTIKPIVGVAGGDPTVALAADLAHDANSVALVFQDPTAALNGWWRKVGATGTGNWLQFEKLSSAARAEVQPLVDLAHDWAAKPAGDVDPINHPGEKSAYAYMMETKSAQTSFVATTGPYSGQIYKAANGDIIAYLAPQISDRTKIVALQSAVAALQGPSGSGATTKDWSDLKPRGSVLGFTFDGDSISRAYKGIPVVNGTAYSEGLMYAGGVRPDDNGGTGTPADPGDFSSLVPIKEQLATSSSFYGETPATGFARMWAKLYNAAFGAMPSAANQLPLISSTGEGGYTAAQYASTLTSTRFSNAITNGKPRAIALGKTYYPVASLVSLGTNDSTSNVDPAAFKTTMRGIQTAHQSVARTAIGSTSLRWPMLMAQCSKFIGNGNGSGAIAVATAELCASDDMFGFVTPMYALPTYADDTHPGGFGEAWLGAYFALAAWEWLMLGRKPTIFTPTVTREDARTFILTWPLEAGLKLVIDNTVATPNYGISAIAPSGSAVTLASTPELAGNSLVVRTSADVLTGGYIGVGLIEGGTTSAQLGKGRTSIRDNRSDNALYTIDIGDGVTRRLDRWSAHAKLLV